MEQLRYALPGFQQHLPPVLVGNGVCKRTAGKLDGRGCLHLRHIAEEIRHTYTIGFVPQVGRQDGAFHRLRVAVRASDGREMHKSTGNSIPSATFIILPPGGM